MVLKKKLRFCRRFFFCELLCLLDLLITVVWFRTIGLLEKCHVVHFVELPVFSGQFLNAPLVKLACMSTYEYGTLSSTGWVCVLSPYRWFWHHQEHARSAATPSVELFPRHIVINKISVKGKCCCLLISDYGLVGSSCMCPPGSTNTLFGFLLWGFPW